MPRFDRLELGAEPLAGHAGADRARPAQRDWLRQADQERRKGQYEAALRCYSRALEQDKTAVAAWAGQVQMLTLLGEAPEADTWSRKALELFPGNGELLASRAQALARLGKLQEAMALSDGSLAAAGQSAFRWLARGELMVALGQSTDRHCFDKAYQIEADWLVRLEAAAICLHYQKASRGHAFARQAVELAADQFHAWYVRGCCEAELGLEQQAEQSLLHCLQLCPGHQLANEQLRRLGRRGRFARLLAWLTRWRRG
jgi:tetratricopeptide (TPR) repeat protein